MSAAALSAAAGGPLHRRWVLARLGGERGSATLGAVVVLPVVMLLTFGMIQGALWYHARNVALHAASSAAQAAAVEGGTQGDGQAAAERFLVAAAGGLENPLVAVSASASTVEASVSGSSPSLLPGVSLTVAQSASAPREGWTTGGSP